MKDDDQQTAAAASQTKRKLVFILPLVLFGAMVLLLFSGLGKDPTKLESQLIGKPIPTFEKTLLFAEQKKVTNKDIKGPALINVFGSWCPSCYQEHPHLMKLAEQKEVRIYGLNYKDSRENGIKFVNDLGNPYEFILFDNNGRLGIELGVYGAPETFVINAENQIIYRHVGVVTVSLWQTKIKPMLYPANEAGTQDSK